MQRHTISPRPDWPARVSEAGLTYHSHDKGPYWDESACYELTAEEVATLENSANALHRLCLEAAEAVIQNNWWSRLAIPERAVGAIVKSWENDEFSLYGRFDLAYMPGDAPKLLEYNADTPTALLGAAVAQWFWLQDVQPDADQFNSIHERLIAAWKPWAGRTIHFSGVRDHPEDEQTVLYLRDTCIQAGGRTRAVGIDDIGWDARRKRFVDLDLEPIECCFKLYPWEWLWAEEFSAQLNDAGARFIEPAWKMLLSNKGLLPVLWELFPDHPNLLPAYEDAAPLGNSYVRKPRLSREGANITCLEHGEVIESTDGAYGEEGYVYQALGELPVFDGLRPVLGVWMVDHEAAGLGIREDTRRITGDLSRFVPHYFH